MRKTIGKEGERKMDISVCFIFVLIQNIFNIIC
jgi:hypothetical protein